MTDGEASGNEEPDITDEHARLLHAGIILKPNAHRNMGRLGNSLDVFVLFEGVFDPTRFVHKFFLVTKEMIFFIIFECITTACFGIFVN